MAGRSVDLLLPAHFSAATHEGLSPAAEVVALGGTTMGTGWSVQFATSTPALHRALAARIEAQLDRLVEQLSHWQPASALSRWNRAPAGSHHALPEALAEVLEAALRIAEASDGALDPTLGALVDLWGFGPPGPRQGLPTADEVHAARARGGWRRLRRTQAGWVQPGAMQLDLSAIAKGHAVDHLAGWLDRAGLRHHLVEIGGELRGQGVKPDGMPWWVDIESPAGVDALPTRIALDGLSVATSGDAIRRYEHAGRRYAHTLDPRTGMPLVNAPAAVTVIHPLCREADGWATALTVVGPDAGLRLADRLGLAARWVGGERVQVSNGWRALREC